MLQSHTGFCRFRVQRTFFKQSTKRSAKSSCFEGCPEFSQCGTHREVFMGKLLAERANGLGCRVPKWPKARHNMSHRMTCTWTRQAAQWQSDCAFSKAQRLLDDIGPAKGRKASSNPFFLMHVKHFLNISRWSKVLCPRGLDMPWRSSIDISLGEIVGPPC